MDTNCFSISVSNSFCSSIKTFCGTIWAGCFGDVRETPGALCPASLSTKRSMLRAQVEASADAPNWQEGKMLRETAREHTPGLVFSCDLQGRWHRCNEGMIRQCDHPFVTGGHVFPCRARCFLCRARYCSSLWMFTVSMFSSSCVYRTKMGYISAKLLSTSS